ncbi:D-glucuronyl C5-epimerase family protein [Shewanella oncorhynchi]|uniref:D-glucuronyl C5-epimerase family protein n=1 Tax=Shewanella oncorhynchi TaxID=2726434 RepID=UPI003D7B18BD
MFTAFKRKISQMKRWLIMLLGRSHFHHSQRSNYTSFTFDKNLYPSNLESKLAWNGFPDENGIPMNKMSDGNYFHFPIALAQKAISYHDNYQQYKENSDLEAFQKIVLWLVENQHANGGWDCWSKSEKPTISNYSSMAQGEIISVLVRYLNIFKDDSTIIENSCHMAYKCLQSDLLMKVEDNYVLHEETPLNYRATILNGHVFTLWGIMDYDRYFNNSKSPLQNKSIHGLKKLIRECDRGYWSDYDVSGRIASPFYHELHIEQIKALYYQTNDPFFYEVVQKWSGYNNNTVYRFISFIIKAKQKLLEKSYNEFIA